MAASLITRAETAAGFLLPHPLLSHRLIGGGVSYARRRGGLDAKFMPLMDTLREAKAPTLRLNPVGADARITGKPERTRPALKS